MVHSSGGCVLVHGKCQRLRAKAVVVSGRLMVAIHRHCGCNRCLKCLWIIVPTYFSFRSQSWDSALTALDLRSPDQHCTHMPHRRRKHDLGHTAGDDNSLRADYTETALESERAGRTAAAVAD
jgi:hypothetical protein